MSLLRWLSIPLLVLAFAAGPVYWAFPEGLSAARTLGIVLGWLSLLLLMVGLAATFATRVPYRSWLWLHVSLGVGVLAGLWHLLQLVEPGVLARVHGAFGTFLAERLAAPQLWLAGGIGIPAANKP
jgi:predicted ferric reductase